MRAPFEFKSVPVSITVLSTCDQGLKYNDSLFLLFQEWMYTCIQVPLHSNCWVSQWRRRGQVADGVKGRHIATGMRNIRSRHIPSPSDFLVSIFYWIAHTSNNCKLSLMEDGNAGGWWGKRKTYWHYSMQNIWSRHIPSLPIKFSWKIHT